MKNTFIVIRNINSMLSSVDYQPIVDTFTMSGFNANKIILLPYDNVSLLFDTVSVEKNECENIVIISDGVLIQSLKTELSRFLERDFYNEYAIFEESCNFFVVPAGKYGVESVKAVCIPYLTKKFGAPGLKYVIKMIGAPMSKVQKAITDASDLSRNTIGFNLNERYGDMRIDILYGRDTAKILLDSVVRIFVSELQDYIYCMDEDKRLEEKLFEALTVRRMKCSVAESFTGGGVVQRIVSVPGASSVLHEGLVTYSNESKEDRLGVGRSTLFEYGAVSDETAYEMAAGLIQTGKCDLAISTTGIAGPASDNTDKPIGLCYIGVGLKDQVYVFKFKLGGDREKITNVAINYALYQAFKLIR